MIDLSSLNKKQKEAVKAGAGPLLIVAGAGTGKTTVITNRIAFLIESGLAKPEEILAMTFTDKAANEMLTRVDQLLSRGYADLWISTFHSFCDRVLRECGLAIGLPTDFKLLDQTSAWLLLRQNFSQLKLDYYRPMGSPTKFLHALIDHFSRCKDQGIAAEDYLDFAKKTKAKQEKDRLLEVANAYAAYQKLLLDNGLLDFGDLINYCLKLFKERPQILEKYQKQFKYILVDEFQDTNFSQYELVKMLARPKNNLAVCADANQAIYRWRGASFGNIVNFKKDFPKAKIVFLEENYRSHQGILDLAFKFLKIAKSNQPEWLEKINKKLKAAKPGAAKIEHLHFKTGEQENIGVAEKILKLMKEDKSAGGASFNDFVILVRANNQAASFSRALERAGIPFQFLAMRGLYSKPIIIDIISYFKLLDNYHESASAFKILNLPFLAIAQEDIASIGQYASRKAKSIFEAFQELPLIPNLSEKTKISIGRILSLLAKHAALAAEKNVSEILLAFLEDFGYLEYLVKRNKKEDLDLISQFLRRIKSFEETHLDARLKPFMEELALELDSGEEGKMDFDPDQGPEVVKIMTVHAAKGLEFKYVFLVNLVDKRFPSIERGEPIDLPEKLIKDILPAGDFHLEEERRLFYVAMTRAKSGLFLTSADDYGGVQMKRLSRFLIELGYTGAKGQQAKPSNVKIVARPKTEKLMLPERFSFTQLIAFSKCPLQYKFAHVMKVPVRGKAVFSFGKSMHNALAFFLDEKAVGKNVGFERLMEIFKKEWIDDWYESKAQQEEYWQLGEKSLRRFWEELSRKKPKIMAINDMPALEQDFNIKVGGHTLIGKIDRIDDLGQGEAELIDYKTGSAKDKLRPEDKKQLLIYQIAAKEVLGLKPKKLTYYYLDEGSIVSFLGTEADIEQEKKDIVEEIEAIKKSDFSPTPGWQCDWCDFKGICEFAKKA